MIEYELIARLVLSVILGAIVGTEREMCHRPAGLRTNALVCMGACLFTILASVYFGPSYAAMLAGIVTGVGFLGAGVIMNSGKEIHGMTTATSLWMVAAVGMGVGIGAYEISIAATLLAFIVLKMRFLEEPLKNMKR